MIRSTKSQAACSLALLIIGQVALAGSFSVSPVRVHLSQQQPAGMLTVHNRTDQETIVQLQPNVWWQEGGADVLERTTELIVVPPLLTLKPGGSQVVRIGLRKAPPAGGELSYRLLLREVPPPPAKEFHGLQVALNISLPVFVQPVHAVQAEMHLRLVRAGEGRMELHVSNIGDAHIQFQQLSLADGAGTELTGRELPAYLLPGQRRIWQFETDAAAELWSLSADTDGGALEAELLLEAN